MGRKGQRLWFFERDSGGEFFTSSCFEFELFCFALLRGLLQAWLVPFGAEAEFARGRWWSLCKFVVVVKACVESLAVSLVS